MFKNKIDNYIFYLVFILPFILAYMIIFILSMGTALDRFDYLRLMDINIETRVEPLLPLVSYFFNFVITDSYIKLTAIQFSFLFLLLISFYNYFKPNNIILLSKVFLALLLCLIVFSNPLGIQLRMGYATIIFIYIISSMKKPYLFLFIPVLMHYGLIFSVLFFIYFYILKIDSKRKFLINSIFILIILTIFFINIGSVFSFLGVSAYYHNYLNEELDFGRAIPYSVIMYILICCCILFFVKSKENIFHWFSISGLWLVYVGFFLDFYLAFKMLVPISMFSIIYLVKNLPNSSNPYFYMILSYIIAPIAFFYFSLQVDIF